MNARDLRAIEWAGPAGNGWLRLLDQRVLPQEETWVECRTAEEVAAAIRDMTVRGAPAIGITAAYGVALAVQTANRAKLPDAKVLAAAQAAADLLAATRPTAVNLFWALDRCRELMKGGAASAAVYLERARSIHEDDVAGNRRIGELGAAHLDSGMGVLTHCNAGALATGGYGTGLGPIFVAHEEGKRLHVFVDETRPRLQGARLTAYELAKVGVPFTLICDNMAASLMAKGKIQFAITGADRIAANGDVANKIGTYSVAVNAAYHQVPFHVAAPKSTFDLAIADGSKIVIEERSASEVTDWGGARTCPAGAAVYNPGFDVTPAKLVRSLFTERGEISPVTRDNVARVLGG
jgi:methylthioribose-1-phosphate isomerase